MRPDPETILAKVNAEEAIARKGKLKIFLGAAAGVGKTFTMLGAAQRLKANGMDVVAGIVVTHGRQETEALLTGLESIPLKTLEYKSSNLKEFDLDAALTRHPGLILVDELAHTNALGSRHEKRWQDVEELLEAGINVFTTMNIQHLESINDIVAQITGIQVRETVPDSIFERAYEIELVDLPPDELIQRFKEGKVYLPEQSQTALKNFFRKGNLIALRELALRFTAEQVDAQMQKFRDEEFIQEIWPVSERILVCVGPSPLSEQVVRKARRMSTGLHAELIAAYVESPAYQRLDEQSRNRLVHTLRLAEQLGAETITLTGTNVSEELVAFARRRNVSKIVIGKPARPRWREILFGSVVDELVRNSGEIDIYVITGENITSKPTGNQTSSQPGQFSHYLYALGGVVLATCVAKIMFGHFALVNLVMVYQLVVVLIALQWGAGPSVLASVLSVLVFDFCFIPPYLSFAISDTEYLITLGVMLFVALILSTLMSQVRHQANMARQREHQTATLYALTRDLAFAINTKSILQASVKHLTEVFDGQAAVLMPDTKGHLAQIEGISSSFLITPKELGVAQWVYNNKQNAGIGTATLPGAKAIYLPLVGTQGSVGVIGLVPTSPKDLLPPERMHLLETFVNQIALALERARLSEEREKTRTITYD